MKKVKKKVYICPVCGSKKFDGYDCPDCGFDAYCFDPIYD